MAGELEKAIGFIQKRKTIVDFSVLSLRMRIYLKRYIVTRALAVPFPFLHLVICYLNHVIEPASLVGRCPTKFGYTQLSSASF